MSTDPRENQGFEQTLDQLEVIVQRMEQGDLPLDEALQEFERGIQLVKAGQAKLDQAEQKVRILLADESGNGQLQPVSPDKETDK